MREFRDSNLPSVEQQLFSTEPVYKNLDTALLTDSLSEMQDALGKDNPDVQKVLQGRTPADAAKDLIANTKLDDVAVRKQLYAGGQAAIDASTDPLIMAMRAIDPTARIARKQFEDKIDSVVRRDGTIVAKARFAQSGFNQPPDATFTLRLSYGDGEGLPAKRQDDSLRHSHGGRLRACCRTWQPVALQPAGELDEVENKRRPEDSAELRFHRRHYRRQFRIAHGEHKGRSGWNHLRRQHRIAAVELCLQRSYKGAPFL